MMIVMRPFSVNDEGGVPFKRSIVCPIVMKFIMFSADCREFTPRVVGSYPQGLFYRLG